MNKIPGLEFLHSGFGKAIEGTTSDQRRGVPHPPLEKSCPEGAPLIALPAPATFTVGNRPLHELIAARRSRRKFTDEPITLEELAFLLWATQGVQEIIRDGIATLRTVPSGGARHPFETYLMIHHVDGIEPGLYRYLALEHQLCFISAAPDLNERLLAASVNQNFVVKCAVTFIWTAIPYRTAWRYAATTPKLIALDVGHLCQNLYLAAEALNLGTCAIGAYDQPLMDALLGLDGEEELVVYMAPVGKLPKA